LGQRIIKRIELRVGDVRFARQQLGVSPDLHRVIPEFVNGFNGIIGDAHGRDVFQDAEILFQADDDFPDLCRAAGVFDLDVDSNGRWSVEKFKGLLFQLEREANQVAKATRRGKGNIVICGSDVASALSMAGVLDHTPALNTNLNVDDTGNTFVGTLHGRTKVYIDPYFSSAAGTEYATVGYKGPTPYDAGIFYCPYVPLQMVRAVGENNFQPKIAFKTRYGIATNPFVSSSPDPTNNTNSYYRIIRVDNLM